MKEFLASAGVPTARFASFIHEDEGVGVPFRRWSPPYVIKTDGLRRAKGVLVTRTSPSPT